jgi:hypothetical protein
MGTSFVEIDEKGFWMQDSVLELWLRLLALHIDDPVEGSIGREIRDRWLLASRGYFVGCIPIALDKAVEAEEGKKIVSSAIDSLMIALENGPDKLNCATLEPAGV